MSSLTLFALADIFVEFFSIKFTFDMTYTLGWFEWIWISSVCTVDNITSY